MLDREVTEAGEDVERSQGRLMARSGVESVRTVFSWTRAEPTGPTATDFSRTDRLVAEAARRRIDLLPIVMYTPPWAARNSHLASPPTRPSDYAAYLGKLVDRYGPRGSLWRDRPSLPKRPVRSWQIWNEPHLEWQWHAPGWDRDYVELLKLAHAAIKQRDRGARVVLAGLVVEGWEELEDVYAAGGGPYFDVAAAHTYTGTPAYALEILDRFREEMNEAGDRRKPLWATEVSWPASRGRNTTGPHFLDHGDGTMARYLTRFYRAAASRARRLRLQRVFWYTWASGYVPGRELFEYSGLLTFANGETRPRPAFRAFRRSARRLQGCAKTDRGRCRSGGRKKLAHR
jgi:hypothetical protein